MIDAAKSFSEARRLGIKIYRGKVCEKHPDLGGERRAANGKCIGCVAEWKRLAYLKDVEEQRKRGRERSKIWYNNNRHKKAQAVADRNLTIPEEVKRGLRRSYESNRRKSDPQYRILKAIRSRTRHAVVMAGKLKKFSTTTSLGCSSRELVEYLEGQFDGGMNWGNYGVYWCVDHIAPLCSFDLSDKQQFETAVHFSNLRPMPVKENGAKAAVDRLKKWAK